MRRGLAAGVIAALFAGAAMAEPIELTGTIGGRQVFLDLNRNGDTLSGWYFYLKTGKQIRLDGRIDRHGFFDIEEHTADTNSLSGSFAGRVKDGHWRGTWKNATGKSPAGKSPRPIAFEALGPFKNADGHYRCTAKRKDESFGYSLSHSLDLTLAKGRVRGLTLTRRSKADGEEAQSCSLSLRDLRPAPAKTGLLLRAKTEPNRCSLRIVAAGDYLLIRPGQANQAGDDCRSAGERQFCTPRAFWSDLVVNRKTQTCKSVE